MATCPKCGKHVASINSVDETEKHSLRPDAKTAVLLILALYGLASWGLLALSVPPWARRTTDPIGYEGWLESLLAIPVVRIVVLVGAVVGLIVFCVELIGLIRKSDKPNKKIRKKKYGCPMCGHTWN